MAEGGADQQEGGKRRTLGDDRADCGLDSIEQGKLEMQIVDRIGRDAEFGKDHEVRAGGVCAVRLRKDRIPVEAHVGRPDRRGRTRDTHEAMPVQREKVVGSGAVCIHDPLAPCRPDRSISTVRSARAGIRGLPQGHPAIG